MGVDFFFETTVSQILIFQCDSEFRPVAISDPNVCHESCVDLEVAHLSILMVQRLLYKSTLP